MVIGSALALAFTPKTGVELRKAVQDFVNDEISRWQSCHDGKCHTHEAPKAEIK